MFLLWKGTADEKWRQVHVGVQFDRLFESEAECEAECEAESKAECKAYFTVVVFQQSVNSITIAM